MQPSQVQELVEMHETYWDDLRPTLRDLRMAYLHHFWDRTQNIEAAILVETSNAYEFIESYIASLFSRNPSVNVQEGLRPGGDKAKAEAAANDFLTESRTHVENASRLALIYPSSFVKLTVNEQEEIEGLVSMHTVPPWHIIVDRDAQSWDKQRFLGHIYWLSYQEAIEAHGSRKFEWVDRSEYWVNEESDERQDTPDDKMFKYIKVVELYDLQKDMLYFWSPNFADGARFLSKSVIPFTTENDKPIVPISPLYYGRVPDRPMDGYSALRRVYDQLEEINYIRTYQANAVRKAARQWVVKNGAFTEGDLERMTSGVDGLFLPTDEEDVRKAIFPVPHTPTPPELEAYYQQVLADADRGNILAPFTRGEATKASATEIVSLQKYTSSEVGRLSREKDALIEDIAKIYTQLLAWFLRNSKSTTGIILLDGAPTVIGADDLSADFRFFSEDSGQTPMSMASRKSEVLVLIPQLLNLGVPKAALLDYLADTYSLPESLLQQTEDATQESVNQPPPGAEPNPTMASGPESLMGLEEGGI